MDVLAQHFLLIKAIHIGLAMLSGGVFAGRGLAVLAGGADLAMARPVRKASMLIDSALLVAALLLVATLRLDPVSTPWLLAKLVLLMAYIVFGVFALRRARSTAGRIVAYVAALLCFTLIFSIARTHDPAGMLRLLLG